MKKLLSILGVIGIGIAPVATVIACGETDSKNKDDNDNDQVIGEGKLKLDARKILEELGDDIYGEPTDAVQKFLKVFAYAMAADISNDDHTKKYQDKLDLNKENTYINDNFIETIKDDFENFTQDTKTDWDTKVEKAKKDYGNNYETEFKKQLEKETNRKYDTIEQYQAEYIFNQAINGTNQSNPLNAFSQEITGFAKGTGRRSVNTQDSIMADLSRNLFNQETKFDDGNIIVNFAANNKTFKNAGNNSWSGDERQNTWFGQFDNFIKGLNADQTKNKTNYDNYVPLLINLINATGGLNLEEFLADDPSAMKVSDVKWATLNNIKTEVLSSDNAKVQPWSNKLLKRIDFAFNDHFGVNVESGKSINVSNLARSGEIYLNEGTAERKKAKLDTKYSTLFDQIPNFTTEKLDKTSVSGLVSNSQRYFTDWYYRLKKPVAITEFVVKPFITDGVMSLKDEIDTKPYISATDQTYEGLYQFIKIFVNSDIKYSNDSSIAPKDYTKDHFENQSNYSWDVLVNNHGDLNKISGNGSTNGWAPANVWKGLGAKLEEVKHNGKLLTVDSSDSDNFNDILKYSVYDMLQKDTVNEYNAWTVDSRKDTQYTNDYDLSQIKDPNQKEMATRIAALIHNLDRNGNDPKNDNSDQPKTENNVYQVLNAEQGIIAFVADDGIHFARIEAYPLLKDKDLLSEQKKITTKDDSSTTAFATYEQFANNFSKNETIPANSALANTTDYLNNNVRAQDTAKIEYKDLNNTFGNKYLEFLVNASLGKSNIAVNTSNTLKYDFDITKDVTSWLSTTSTSQDFYWIAIWDYLKMIFNYQDDEAMFNDFFELDSTADQDQKDTFTTYKKIILDTINSERNLTMATPSIKLLTQWQTYQNKYENKSNQEKGSVFYPPFNYINNEDSNKSTKLNTINLWKFDSVTPQAFIVNYKVTFEKYFIWDQQLNQVIVREGKVN